MYVFKYEQGYIQKEALIAVCYVFKIRWPSGSSRDHTVFFVRETV
jgi:hypothetical protein